MMFLPTGGSTGAPRGRTATTLSSAGIEDRREDVDVGGQGQVALTRGHDGGPAHHQRDQRVVLVQEAAVSEIVVLEQALAVVRVQHHKGVGRRGETVDRVEEAADLGVGGEHAVGVAADVAANLLVEG